MEGDPLSELEILTELQALLGRRVEVSANAYGEFLGLAFAGELLLARSLPPDHSAIQLELSGGEALFFDPAGLSARRYRSANERWLELSTATGLTVMIELAVE